MRDDTLLLLDYHLALLLYFSVALFRFTLLKVDLIGLLEEDFAAILHVYLVGFLEVDWTPLLEAFLIRIIFFQIDHFLARTLLHLEVILIFILIGSQFNNEISIAPVLLPALHLAPGA